MKERPILFKGQLVRAILDGRKTQTRRPVKPQPTMTRLSSGPGQTAFTPPGKVSIRGNHPTQGASEWFYRCPYGQPGDVLWVRETWRAGEEWNEYPPSEIEKESAIWYDADGWCSVGEDDWGKARPSIHMLKWVCRLRLRVTGVRVERVQQISESAAESEGAEPINEGYDGWYGPGFSYRAGVREGWKSIYGGGDFSWGKNPWVWVVTFEVLS